jgi:hypothetical protein
VLCYNSKKGCINIKIKFIKIENISDQFYPQPAYKMLPDWYKDTPGYLGNNKVPFDEGSPKATIKKCMPVFDSMTSGYIITSHVDVWVKQQETEKDGKQPYFVWPTGNPLGFHAVGQAKEHPGNTGFNIAYPKWVSPWAIKTPKGYSCFFVQPMHRESVFEILPGIVDTDKWYPPVNFPFVLKDIGFEGLIPAGTPIAQVIPFKRESWSMEFGSEKDILETLEMEKRKHSVFYDYYKNITKKGNLYK